MKSFLNICLLLLLISCSEEKNAVPSLDKKDQNKQQQKELIEVEIPETAAIDILSDTLNYLALGDSYTIGSGVKEDDRWPNQFVAACRNKNISIEDPEIVAASGWTTGNLLTAVESRNLKSKYDLASLLIGVNNQYQGMDFSTFQNQFIQLLEYSFRKVKSRNGLFVLSIPDYGVTPFGKSNQSQISEEINMYNTWIREVCNMNNIKFYDITEISRLAENDLSFLADDGLHPSGKMYGEWIKLIINDPPELLKQ